MPQTDLPRRRVQHPVVLAVASLITLPFLVGGIGFIFHTSFDPVVFGKYSLGYFLFLCLWWLLVTPGVFFLARFVFLTQTIELRSGRRLYVRPSFKLVVLIAFVALLVLVATGKITKGVRRAATTGHNHFHPYLQNIPARNSRVLPTNIHGFRGGPLLYDKAPNEIRIFVFGGSTVFNGRLPYEYTHPYLLQQRLQAAYPDLRINVQNVGADWHSTQHSVFKYLFQVRLLQPDVVILYHGINDLYRSFVPDLFAEGSFQHDYSHYYGAATTLVLPERRWDMLALRFGTWFSDFRCQRVRVIEQVVPELRWDTMLFPKAEPYEVTSWPSQWPFSRNLRHFVHMAEADGVPVILASQPYLYREDLTAAERELIWFPAAQQHEGRQPSLASMIAGMERFNEITRNVVAQTGVDFVDLESMVPKTTEYFTDDVHYTPAACELIAEAFAHHILETGLIDRVLAARPPADPAPAEGVADEADAAAPTDPGGARPGPPAGAGDPAAPDATVP